MLIKLLILAAALAAIAAAYGLEALTKKLNPEAYKELNQWED